RPRRVVERSKELVEDKRKLSFVRRARAGRNLKLEALGDGRDPEPGVLGLPHGNRSPQRRLEASGGSARLDPEAPTEAGLWPLLDAHARVGPGDGRAVSVAAAGRLGEIPPRAELRLDAAEAERELGVARVREHVTVDVGAQGSRKV